VFHLLLQKTLQVLILLKFSVGYLLRSKSLVIIVKY